MSDPKFVILHFWATNGKHGIVSQSLDDHVDPEDFREFLIGLMSDKRDEFLETTGTTLEREEWWYGDPSYNAFIRDRSYLRLDWEAKNAQG